jgi:hypothetical protein
LHLLWWTRKKLHQEPQLALHDIRAETALPIDRQIDLAKWSMLMIRLCLLADIGYFAHGSGSRVAGLASIAEDAATHAELNWRKLLRWMQREAAARFDRALSEATYRRLSEELHKDPFDGAPG